MKKSLYLLVILGMFAALIVSGCGDILGTDKKVSSGQNSVVVGQSAASLAECANGGIKVESGIDDNSNGVLDASEVDKTQYVCNGTNGTNGTNGNNGSDGAPGATGPAGASVTLTAEPAGANCENGGTKVSVAGGTPPDVYVCNGADLMAGAKAESCAVCHGDAGAAHQAVYNDYKDTTLTATIDSVTSVASGTYFNTTLQFTIKKNGMAYVPATSTTLNKEFDQSTVYAVKYDSATRTFGTAVSFPTASFTYQGNGVYTAPATTLTYAPESSSAQVYIYVVKGKLKTEGMALYSDVANKGKTYGDAGSYVSAANVSGCEKCHGTPYMKHGYRAGTVSGLADFGGCKVCHYDSRNGGHQDWQLLVDDTPKFAALNAVAKAAVASGNTASNSVGKNMTAAEKAKYAYKASVMNDVHMSHAMEFAYPQSMANCVTCHAGKLASTMTDTNFTVTTCRSCHPITAADGTDSKRAPALKTIMLAKFAHTGVIDNLYADASTPATCNGCHTTGGIAPVFSALHTGYNTVIYADAAGTKYSDVFTVSIDSASVTNNVVTVNFSAAEASPGIDGLAVTDISPSVYFGLYGYDTKDMIARESGTKVSGANGAWVYTVDLKKYAARIADGSVKRVEIAVLPSLGHPTKTMVNRYGVTVPVPVALNAPSKTFDLGANAFVNYFSPIVNVAGCNKCHEALGTTFHTADRGGNVTVCRTCHQPSSGGGHLEMQSRSIDSYVHAIHSFQPFDIKNVDFNDPVEELEYEHHVESTYPNFTILNCESCHYAGTYGVPNQAKSLPGLHSAANTVTTMDRNIGAVPSYVTGPGSRACGSCHRAELINEDDAAGLTAFNEHTKTNGYMLENETGLFDEVIDTIMSLFK